MVKRYVNVLLQLVIVSLCVCGGVVAQEEQLLCKGDDVEILYSPCGPYNDGFTIKIEPCTLTVCKWKIAIFWIPRADLTILNAEIKLSYGAQRALSWKGTLCHGQDDDYSYCGSLKGETVNTTVNASSAFPSYPKGNYTVYLRIFSGHHKELICCMKYTLKVTQ